MCVHGRAYGDGLQSVEVQVEQTQGPATYAGARRSAQHTTGWPNVKHAFCLHYCRFSVRKNTQYTINTKKSKWLYFYVNTTIITINITQKMAALHLDMMWRCAHARSWFPVYLWREGRKWGSGKMGTGADTPQLGGGGLQWCACLYFDRGSSLLLVHFM